MKTKKRLVIPAVAIILLAVLASCSGGPGSGPSENNISGVVLLPAQQVAARARPSLLARILGIFIPDTNANLIGLVPVSNTTVELVRLDSLGNITEVLDTTTSDPNGAYTFTTSYAPSSTLAVVLPYEPVTTRAIVTTANGTDITPVSEAIFRAIVTEIIDPPVSALENFTVKEVAALVDLVESMNIDVSGATTFNDAVNTVLSQAGSVLINMVKSFSTPANVTAFYQNNYALLGMSTTLIPPYQLNGTTAGIDHRAVDGFFGFQSISSLVNGGVEYADMLLNDLSTASYFCDSKSTDGGIFLSAPNGRMIVSPVDGSGATVGALSPDNTIMVYPTLDRFAAPGGSGNGEGAGLRIAMQWDNNIGSDEVNLNAAVNGVYNMIWAAGHMDPQGGAGTGPLGGSGTFTIATGSATVTFDGASTDINGRSGFTSSNTSIATLTADLADGNIGSSAAPETFSGVYEVFPGNKIIATLGDPGIMLGNLSSSIDFLRGMRSIAPMGDASSLIAFSASLAGGNMGAGGGMGLGDARCSNNTGGSSSGMMGSANGEGRGLAVAALQTVGLTEADVAGTYNVVGELTRFSAGNGALLISTESRFGTLALDGAGNISGGNLFYKRSTMDIGGAVAGSGGSLTIVNGNESLSGSYNVSAVDGRVTLSLATLGTGTGFVTPDGQFMAFPIESTSQDGGSRGLLLLLRQP